MPNVAPKAQSVPTIKDFKESSEAISALKCVILDSDTTCAIGDKDTANKVDVYGVSISAAPAAGIDVEIVNYGQIDDVFFTFLANTTLYLGNNGVITDIPPVTGFRTIIGKGLGVGSIFVNISESIKLV